MRAIIDELVCEIEGIYAVWLREYKIYLREKERVISSVVSPLLWIFFFGVGISTSVNLTGAYRNIPYLEFLFAGILVMTVLFTSLFFGVYVIWDRKLDFLKEVLVAPVSRTSVFLGKMLGGCTDAMIQVVVLLIIGIIVSLSSSSYRLIGNISFSMLLSIGLLLLLISVAMVSLGLMIGASLVTPEGFTLVINFVMWPFFFLSGAIFQLENLPPWLYSATSINPLTYGVDAVRGGITGVSQFPLHMDVLILILFALFSICLGAWSFKKM